MSLNRVPRQWWNKPPPERDRVCYRTKTAALTAFLDENYQIVENYGGPNYGKSPSEFDAINHKYGLRGRKAARTIAEAVWAAMPKGRPFCLDEIDLDALNDTSPAHEAGMNFRLPAHVYETQAQAEQERYYRQMYNLGLVSCNDLRREYDRARRRGDKRAAKKTRKRADRLRCRVSRWGLGHGDKTDFDPKQVRVGMQVECEHSPDKRVRAEIVADHLTEDPRYYSKLCKLWPRERGCRLLR